jgi:Protein of unknown function (DUF1439)
MSAMKWSKNPIAHDMNGRLNELGRSLLGVVLACAFSAGCGISYTIRLTAADLQQTLHRKLPVSKSKLLVTATVRSLDVELTENGDLILLRPEVDLGIAGQSALRGRAVVAGQLRYAPETGEFFFDQPKVTEVAIVGLPDSLRPAAEELVARCAEGYLASTPVYRLKQGDFQQSLAKLVLKSVRTRNGQLEIVIGTP